MQIELANLADLEKYQVSKYVNGNYNDILLGTALRICHAVQEPLHVAFADRIQILTEKVGEKLENKNNDQ
jgi:hypothetical protein